MSSPIRAYSALEHTLGVHIIKKRIHGHQLHKRRELKVASFFKHAPAAFLRMIVAHELTHMKHAQHDARFYKLCRHMEPDYHQLESDLWMWLWLRSDERPND